MFKTSVTTTSFTLSCWLLSALLLACGGTEPEGPQPTPPEPAADASADAIERQPAQLESMHEAFDALIAADAEIEILATGFDWSEGPVWVRDGDFLLFSDVPRDTVFRWHDDDGLEPWLRPSGLTLGGTRSREPGANGLALDHQGRLVLCQHGDRRVARLSAGPGEGPWTGGHVPAPFETLAERYQGDRFNSPNDLVIHADGDIFFTDPPYGLPGGGDSAERELDQHGVYRLTPGADGQPGELRLISAALTRPNGIALSPDGATLYVANSDPERALWMAWDLAGDGAAATGVDGGRVLLDVTDRVSADAPGLPDGMAVDVAGNLFATGPGGVWVLDSSGRHLGTVRLDRPTANCTFGDDGSSLYITSDDRLLRLRTATRGLGFPAP